MGAPGCTEAPGCYSEGGCPWCVGPSQNTKRIKFNGDTIISGKLSNGKKVPDDIMSNKNVVETERTRGVGVARANNRKRSSITHNDGGGEGRGRGHGDHTRVGGDVGRGAGVENPVRGIGRWVEGDGAEGVGEGLRVPQRRGRGRRCGWK